MTTFQWAACSALALALLRELIRLRRGLHSSRSWLVRSLVWAAALVAIADPLLVTRFANAIGIGRGADVVLYLSVLGFLGCAFLFWSRQVRLQRQVNSLAEHIALAEARRGAAPQSGGPS
jgi:hypothetical protein